MKAILVDDEELLLRDAARQLAEYSDIEIQAAFTDPVAALEYAGLHKLDAVFSDISMPEINGLDLAERLTEIQPELEIVFITAHDEYAVKAFELSAFDYLLKPVNRNRLNRTVARLRTAIAEKTPRAEIVSAPVVQVSFFGRFDLKINGEAVRWRSKKAEELFAYLAENVGKPLHKIVLIDNLWPDMEEKCALINLQTTVCRVRRALAPAGAAIHLTYNNDCYRLSVQSWVTDTDEVETELQKTTPDKEKIATLYKEGYMAENGWLWSYPKGGFWDDKVYDYME